MISDKTIIAELKEECDYYKTTQAALCDAMREAVAILEYELGEWAAVETVYLPNRLIPLKVAMLTLNEVLPPEDCDD